MQKDKILVTQRKNQLKRRRDSQYIWQHFPELGLPSGIDDTTNDIPLEEEFTRVKTIDFTLGAAKGLIAVNLAGTFITVDSLEDYISLAKYLEKDSLVVQQADRWTSDVEFGRQILNGVNPVVIKRCKSIPANFKVTDEMVRSLFTRGLSLQQEMAVSF